MGAQGAGGARGARGVPAGSLRAFCYLLSEKRGLKEVVERQMAARGASSQNSRTHTQAEAAAPPFCYARRFTLPARQGDSSSFCSSSCLSSFSSGTLSSAIFHAMLTPTSSSSSLCQTTKLSMKPPSILSCFRRRHGVGESPGVAPFTCFFSHMQCSGSWTAQKAAEQPSGMENHPLLWLWLCLGRTQKWLCFSSAQGKNI